jgi:4-aminobutyrate aminotransferase / (S)-3-amino-2-methylpropionate transaminase / 5-aminovalerate transaminase
VGERKIHASNPLGTAVALEVMKITEEDGFEEKIQVKGKRWLNALKGLQKKYPGYLGDVDGLGMTFRVEICEQDGFTPSREKTDQLFQLGMEGGIQVGDKKYGLILDVGGYYKNILTIAPSFDSGEEELTLACDLLDQLFEKSFI